LKELNIRAKLENWEGNIGINLYDLILGRGFLDTTPKVQAPREKQANWAS
jgi:hypothetical protein